MCEFYCPDCKRNTDVVFDHSAGDTVCTECGLVIEAHSIDESSEWRTFADDSGRNHNDPDRVGDRTNPLLPEGRSLTTFISNTNANGCGGCGGKNSLPRSRNNSVSISDRSILEAFEAVTSMSERLGLVSTIKDRAKEIYSKVEFEKTIRGRNKDAIVAACLYIACRKEEKPRTVKEICSVANGVTKKQLGAAKEFVLKQMEAAKDQLVEMGTIHAEDFVRRFGFHLGMSHQAIKAAQEVVQKSDALDIRRSPVSVAAAVVYIITQLSDDKKALRDIFNATGVSEGTIRNTFKDLYPNLTDLIPTWFAKADKIKSLINS